VFRIQKIKAAKPTKHTGQVGNMKKKINIKKDVMEITAKQFVRKLCIYYY